MGEVRVVIDLPESELQYIEETARKEHRDRKHQLEYILTWWVEKNRGDVKREKQP